MMRALAAVIAMATLASAAPAVATPAPPIEVRVVICTTWEYEPGGKDMFGELKAWKDRWPLTETMPFPGGNHMLHYDPKAHVLALVTGMGTMRAASSVTAIGYDPRFDLSHAYWLVPGTAGVDPKMASSGSVAWARWVVDGDQANEIDIRDAPAGWTTGLIPFGRTEPYQLPAPPAQSIMANMAFPLNATLVDWAYGLTRDVQLADGPELAARRKLYTGEGARPPFVLRGDTLTSLRFSYGGRRTEHARRWVDYWTGGKGVYAMGDMEDSAILQALTQLAGAGRARLDRVLVLRAGDGYTIPPPGVTALEQLNAGAKAGPPGMHQALENLYRTGAPVVRYLTDHWAVTRDSVPGQ
jgi:purine nucleoside permease